MDSTTITVHPLSNHPTEAWESLSKTQNPINLPVSNPDKPVEPNHVRIVCMSDTHNETENFNFVVPNGDILIHAGDFTKFGQEIELVEFNNWLKSLPHKHKIVIAGNHDISFDEDYFVLFRRTRFESVDEMKKLLTHCIYLQDSEVILYGIKFYGSPWQPEHGSFAFGLPRGEKILTKWNLIPSDTDILITHGPPLGHGDLLYKNSKRAGCLELLSTIQQRVKPKYHIYGHIHEGYGVLTDGVTTFINASTCNQHYVPKNKPIVFDYPLPTTYC